MYMVIYCIFLRLLILTMFCKISLSFKKIFLVTHFLDKFLGILAASIYKK